MGTIIGKLKFVNCATDCLNFFIKFISLRKFSIKNNILINNFMVVFFYIPIS